MPVISLYSTSEQHKHDFEKIINRQSELLNRVEQISNEETLYTVKFIDENLIQSLTTYLVKNGSESTNFFIHKVDRLTDYEMRDNRVSDGYIPSLFPRLNEQTNL